MKRFLVKVKGVKRPWILSAPSEQHIHNVFEYAFEHIKIEWIKPYSIWRDIKAAWKL